ncbi:MAG: PadR family transcriptional regulator [Christensenellaceae bacterium]|jgi:DNA-binding PadR family transcriptional regulator|nr:PadR family transcriptional regulator [Christensenellaceae bacterium]
MITLSQNTPRLIKEHSDSVILRILSEQNSYPWEIQKIIEARSKGRFTVKLPTLYNALKRLEKSGYLESYYGEESYGGRRRYYALTERGLTYLINDKDAYTYARTVLDEILSDGEAVESAEKINAEEETLADIKARAERRILDAAEKPAEEKEEEIAPVVTTKYEIENEKPEPEPVVTTEYEYHEYQYETAVPESEQSVKATEYEEVSVVKAPQFDEVKVLNGEEFESVSVIEDSFESKPQKDDETVIPNFVLFNQGEDLQKDEKLRFETEAAKKFKIGEFAREENSRIVNGFASDEYARTVTGHGYEKFSRDVYKEKSSELSEKYAQATLAEDTVRFPAVYNGRDEREGATDMDFNKIASKDLLRIRAVLDESEKENGAVLSGKLNFHAIAATYAVMVIELFIAYFAEAAFKIPGKTLLLIGGIALSLPIIFGGIYFYNQTRVKKAELKPWRLFSVAVAINAVAITFVSLLRYLAPSIFKNEEQNLAYLLSSLISVFAIIYYIFFKSGNYSVE